MNLKEILTSVDILNSNVLFDKEIGKITSDSRKIEKNDIFVAIQGITRDGNEYINEALNRGACVIITDKLSSCLKNVPFILVKNARSALSNLCSNYYRNPSKEMKIIAITGTNGKTSTAFYLYNILKTAQKSVGAITTIECLINDEKIDIGDGSAVLDKYSAMTTPDSEVLFNIINKMREKGVEYLVMEASSHALSQGKLDGLDVDIGAFTNLSSEHMDYHKNMEEYFRAKQILFEKSKIGIVNIDDEYGKIIKKIYKNKIYTCSYKEKSDFFAVKIKNKQNMHQFCFINGEKASVDIKIPGEFSIYNALLASACASVLGINSEYIAEGINSLYKIKGRLEKYYDKNIYIDYAHTPIATENVLNTLKNIEKDKALIVLFGCGGDRDKTKRPEIGKIASKYADVLIITSDNPRSENPLEIIKDIVRGVDKNKAHIIIPNRKDAILYATKLLNENSVVLLLGKGHETYEIDANGKHYFDERDVLKEAFAND